MPDTMTAGAISAALLPLVLLTMAGGIAALGAVLDARLDGVPTSVAVLAPLTETARLLRQQRRSLPGADRLLWRIGGAGLVVAAVLQAAVVPLGSVIPADLPVGVVWFTAVDVLIWACWWLLGWGANSAWAQVGGHRFLGQAISYELPLMFAIICPAVAAGSLRVATVEAAQQQRWFVLQMPVAFVVFAVSVAAFAAWGPFGTPAGADAAGGVLAELSGVDRLLVLAGRCALVVSGAAVAVPLFLGGGAGPVLPAAVWVVVKTALLAGVLVVVARRFPALRPERLAEVAWIVVLPLVLLQLLVVAVLAAAGVTA